MSKIIEIVDPHLTYEVRYKAFRKTLTFRERHFSQEYGVIPFIYMSYKMWGTKILGGFREKFFGKGKKK
jgi:hypothetical protein